MGRPPSTVVATRIVRLCDMDSFEAAEGKMVVLLLKIVGLRDRDGLMLIEGLAEGEGVTSDSENKRSLGVMEGFCVVGTCVVDGECVVDGVCVKDGERDTEG
jgi:hypothetical protein